MTVKKPKIREVWEAVKALILGPYTLPFPKKPSVPFPKFRGKPEFCKEDCVGCGACAEVCPAKAIEIVDVQASGSRGKRKLTLHHDICQFCGQCQANCITEKGVKLGQSHR